jgi:pyruvate dehydrogenase E1 component
VWSVTSFTELRRDGLAREREGRLGSDDIAKTWVEECLGGSDAPVVAATDYMKALPDGIRQWVDARYDVLGTDGFGRSDWRKDLRSFFEVDRYHVAVAALRALQRDGEVESSVVAEAIKKYEIDVDRPDPAVS